MKNCVRHGYERIAAYCAGESFLVSIVLSTRLSAAASDSNSDSLELFSNGKSLGSKPVVRNSHLTCTVEYEPRTIEARSVKNGQVALKERCETTGALAKLLLHTS